MWHLLTRHGPTLGSSKASTPTTEQNQPELSLSFWFAFPWRLVTLSIFSDIGRPCLIALGFIELHRCSEGKPGPDIMEEIQMDLDASRWGWRWRGTFDKGPGKRGLSSRHLLFHPHIPDSSCLPPWDRPCSSQLYVLSANHSACHRESAWKYELN